MIVDLYLTGEQIEWTHKVVFEIMYADFYHANHADLALGPLNVSDPVLSRLAQIQVESKQSQTYDCAKLRLLFRYKRDEFIEMAQEIWQGPSKQSSNGIPLLTLGEGNTLVPIRTDRSELQIELACLFIASMNSPHRFAMHWELFDNEYWEQIIGIVMESAETPYARDLISFHRSEALIPPHHIRFRLTSNDDISYCFALYRRVLMSKFGPGLDSDHPFQGPPACRWPQRFV